jgi:hypothetical protein
MKKKLEHLRITSFITTGRNDIKAGGPSILDPNDPTANTWCYVCPEEEIQY